MRGSSFYLVFHGKLGETDDAMIVPRAVQSAVNSCLPDLPNILSNGFTMRQARLRLKSLAQAELNETGKYESRTPPMELSSRCSAAS